MASHEKSQRKKGKIVKHPPNLPSSSISSQPRSPSSSSSSSPSYSNSVYFWFATFIAVAAIVSVLVLNNNSTTDSITTVFLRAIIYDPTELSTTSNSIDSKNEVDDTNTAPTDLTGDWRPAAEEVLHEYDPGICNIDKVSVSDLPPERFESEFRFKKPVIVTFPGGANDWTEPRKWSRRELLHEYSRLSIIFGDSLDLVRRGGYGKLSSSFEKFLDQLFDDKEGNGGGGGGSDAATGNEQLQYAFDRHFYWKSKLPGTLKLPDYFKVNRSVDDSLFIMGASLTGVVFHKHSDTWNGVVHGRKRWFLYPNTQTPPGGIYHGYTLLDWVHHVYPNLTNKQKPMECVQNAGEIMYLPESTYHATLNLGDTVALAIQKKLASLETEVLFYEATRLKNMLDEKREDEDKRYIDERLVEIYKSLHKMLPHNAEVMMKLGEKLFHLENYVESLTWLHLAIEEEPYFILAYLHMGNSLAKLKEHEMAEAMFLKAKSLSPNLWDIYKEYGEYLMKQGRLADALPVFKRGTELQPDLIPFWYFYKVCQVHIGDEEGAKATEKIIVDIKVKEELEG